MGLKCGGGKAHDNVKLDVDKGTRASVIGSEVDTLQFGTDKDKYVMIG